MEARIEVTGGLPHRGRPALPRSLGRHILYALGQRARIPGVDHCLVIIPAPGAPYGVTLDTGNDPYLPARPLAFELGHDEVSGSGHWILRMSSAASASSSHSLSSTQADI